MKHPDFEELLSAYVNDELPVAQREFIEEHLSDCTDCRDILAEYMNIKRNISSLKELQPLPDISQVIMSQIKTVKEPTTKTDEKVLTTIIPKFLTRKRGLTGLMVFTLVIILAVTLPLLLGNNDNAVGSYVDIIKFNDITYLSKRGVQTSFAEEDLLYFDEVKFKIIGNVNTRDYRVKNGDASFLEEGTTIYSIKGYSPDFRLVAKTGTEMILYEADSNPHAKKGADLLDISGKVEYIGVNSGIDGTTELASITEEGLVTELVDMILEAPVDQTFRLHEGKQYVIAFYLNDGTVVKRGYSVRSGDLSRGIMLPDEFGEIIESITAVEMEAADEIVLTPSGYMYRANFHQQGVANPWLSIETVEIPLDNNGNTAYLRYRQYIVTEPGETRNNIIIVRTPENLDTGELNLNIANINTGIEVVQGEKWSGPGVRSIVLAITTSSDIQPGEYTFEIGIEIDGLDYGTLPCTINTMPGTFHSFLELSAHQVTLEEAEDVIGLAVPVPAYLPTNYEIQEIYAYGDEIIFLISDEEVNKELLDHTDAGGERQRYEFRCRIIITVRWIDNGFYIPPDKIPGTVVDINEGSGKIVQAKDRNDLWYYHQPYPDNVGVFELKISASKTISAKELIKIAESIVYIPLE